jgi:type VI secretion system protein ImpF
MPAPNTQGPVTLSVLDRLIDQEPKNRSEALPTYAQTLRTLKASLRRDLESLLNARRTLQEAPDSASELQRSVYHYGLPDLTSLSARSATDQNKLLKIIETTVTNFEPRLANVKVSLAPVTGNNRLLRFVIEGMLRIDPAPEHVAFDTVLELASGQYEVRGQANGRNAAP